MTQVNSTKYHSKIIPRRNPEVIRRSGLLHLQNQCKRNTPSQYQATLIAMTTEFSSLISMTTDGALGPFKRWHPSLVSISVGIQFMDREKRNQFYLVNLCF